MLYETQNPHGGDVYGAEVAFDFSSNVNPLGTPPNVLAAISHAAMRVRQYPDPYCRALTAAIAAHEAVPEDFILCGAGAAELIYVYCDALRPKKAMELAPTFLEYSAAASHFGAEMVRVPLQAPEFLPDDRLLDKLREEAPDVLFLCTPNNPTGQTIGRSLLQSVLDISLTQGTRVLLDECFLDFTDEKSAKDLLRRYENLLILKAFTKSYALAGLRVGYCLTGDTRLLSQMAACSQPWNVSLPAQEAAVAALQNPGWISGARHLFPSSGNISQGRCNRSSLPSARRGQLSVVLRAGRAGRGSAARKIAIRNCGNYPGLCPGWYRDRCAAGERK
ncbi:MAG: pyridoxal phosphate-dependent aminotransferase [Oscillospiraceae bacterium]